MRPGQTPIYVVARGVVSSLGKESDVKQSRGVEGETWSNILLLNPFC